MNRKIYLLISLVLCVTMGWALGYLRLPYVERDYSFWVGFVGCLGFISFIALLLFVWNKKILSIFLIGNNKTKSDSKKSRYSFIWVLSVLIITSVIVFSTVLYRQNRSYKTQVQNQSIRIKEQSQIIDSVRQSKLMTVMSNVLDKVEDEVDNNPNKALSNETIARIIALSSSFKPYKYFEKDGVLEKKLSPERGQLLLALSIIKIDSSSFRMIKQKVSFSGAEMVKADLRGIDLSGIDLSDANLSDADLTGSNLEGAKLRGINLSQATLDGAKLKGVDLKRANLSWAELNGADLEEAILDGADLSNAKLRNANLRGSTIQWAELGGVMLNKADLSGCILTRVSMVNANLTNAKLTDVIIKSCDLSEAIFVGTEVNKGWLDSLKEWNITGAEELVERYKVLTDTLEGEGHYEFHLEKVLN